MSQECTFEQLRYRVMASPIGDLGLVASNRGLTDVIFEPARAIASLNASHQGRPSRDDRDAESSEEAPEQHLDVAEEQLDEYFRRRRTSFALALDLNSGLPAPTSHPDSDPLSKVANPFRGSSRFRSAAQLAMLHIAYGQTLSYGELAALVGAPGAARAIGTACSTNRIPIILPCHRILRADGHIGGYAGGTGVKAFLLDLEGARYVR